MVNKLTEKEISIILGIKQGLTNAQIADIMGVQKNTVGAYIYRLCRIYGAQNRIDLINKIHAANWED